MAAALTMLALSACSHERPARPADPAARPLERIVAHPDGRGFVRVDSGRPFVPWGFNYDRDSASRLLEDYWGTDWPRVAQDFAEMRALGANVVRIHLQFGRFMPDATLVPAAPQLAQLDRLLELAERTGVYLNLTGLGCYRAADVPAWYAGLGERARWAAQAAFWEAIARRCAASPAVFCYNLMNEPVVPAEAREPGAWLGPPFGGFCYVQFITRDPAGRARPAVAREWTRTLIHAIRRHDPRRLVTVGLVDWSLDRAGLSSGFVPTEVAPELDFVSVHLYPRSGQVADALATLGEFAVGKPLVIEETFPLRCTIDELRAFLDAARGEAAGCLSFYWGQPPDELRAGKAVPDALLADWLDVFAELRRGWGAAPACRSAEAAR